MNDVRTFSGVLYGKTIELTDAPALAEGQKVTVVIEPVGEGECPREVAEAIRQSAGAWADVGDEFDAWLEQVYRDRQCDVREIPWQDS